MSNGLGHSLTYYKETRHGRERQAATRKQLEAMERLRIEPRPQTKQGAFLAIQRQIHKLHAAQRLHAALDARLALLLSSDD